MHRMTLISIHKRICKIWFGLGPVGVGVSNAYVPNPKILVSNKVYSLVRNHESGKVTALWPGSSLHYIQTLAENRWEDYIWEYHGSRYDYWQQGLSWIEDPLVDSLGRAEAEALHSSSMPTKDSDISFYLQECSPLPSPPSVKDECSVEDVIVEQAMETKLSDFVQTNVSAAIPV